jgi:His/Glu/Gln/Arg/opine family amino acid ABC transporter permease subunit
MFNYDWNFSFLEPYLIAFLEGCFVTLYISIVSFVLGTLLGILLGIIIKPLVANKFLFFLNDAIRAVPPLVLIFLVYYFPYKELLGIAPPNALYSSIFALAISQTAYTIDLVRAAIDNVSMKTIQGAQALGFRKKSIIRYIVIPDIVRQTIPAQIAFFIGIIRLSNLASVIGAQEIVFAARTAISNNYRSLEAWIIVALIYIALVLPITFLSRKLEKSKWLKRRW